MTAAQPGATLLLTHELFLEHDPGAHHPESPARLAHVLDRLGRERWPTEQVRWQTPRAATAEELGRVHDAKHLAQLNELVGHHARLDADTFVSDRSVEAAHLAAGAGVQAVEEVASGRARNAFALVRPPGHHAEASHAMGFCLINNAAVAAAHALAKGASRVAVVDFDVHHGNGTQHLFAERNDVLYLSTHQFPFYPGSGAANEIGRGPGRGFTVNCPLPAGMGDADFGHVFADLFLPVLRAFAPDFVIVSAGYDAHARDPIGEMRLSERGYAALSTALVGLADELCGGRIAFLLEGGYHLGALADSVTASVAVLTGEREPLATGGGQEAHEAVAASWAALRETPLARRASTSESDAAASRPETSQA
jgi:acetoin utilization deacetylase AcuC-like enzyme